MHTPPPTHAAPQPDPAAQPPSLPASPAAPPALPASPAAPPAPSAPPTTASTPLAPSETVSLAEITADAAARDRDEDAWCTRELIRRRTHPTPPAHPRPRHPRPAAETDALPLEHDTL